MVQRYEDEEKLQGHASVSDAIIMNLNADPDLDRAPRGPSATPAIEDAPAEPAGRSKVSLKRQRKKDRMGAAEYKSQFTSPNKFANFLRFAHTATVKLKTDYYGSSNGMGMWSLPDFESLTPDSEFPLIDTVRNETEKLELATITEQRTKINKEAAKDVIQEATHEVKRHARQLGILVTEDDKVLAVPKDLQSDEIPVLDEWTWNYQNIFQQLDSELFCDKSQEEWINMFVAREPRLVTWPLCPVSW